MPTGIYNHKPHSIETRTKIGLSHLGKSFTLAHRKHLSISAKLKKFTQKQIDTLKQIHENNRGNKHAVGHRHDAITRERIRVTHLGYKNANWKGGITVINRLIRSSAKYHEWRQSGFMRDGFKCVHCHGREDGIHFHHIKHLMDLLSEAQEVFPLLNVYDAAMLYTPLWDISNGITLCKKCHNTEHKKLKSGGQ